MRRALVLVVVAAVAAIAAGLAIPSDPVTVNGERLSQSQLNDELAAIAASPSWQCYLQAQAYTAGEEAPTAVHGVTTRTWLTATTVEWSNQRVSQLAVVQYVGVHDPAALSPAALEATGPTSPRVSLESDISATLSAATNDQSTEAAPFSCEGAASGAATLASMPTWFQDEQVEAEAADLALSSLTPQGIPLTEASLEAWYATHTHAFDTICLATIATSSASTIAKAKRLVTTGALSFADAARRYSTGVNAKSGGHYGCFAPGSQVYAAVQQIFATSPVGGLSPILRDDEEAPVIYSLFQVTSRTAHPYAEVAPDVLAAVQELNRTEAEVLATQIQRSADVVVSPTLGAWTETLEGGTIVPPSTPSPATVLNPAANAPASSTSTTPVG